MHYTASSSAAAVIRVAAAARRGGGSRIATTLVVVDDGPARRRHRGCAGSHAEAEVENGLLGQLKLMRCCYHCMLGKWDLPAIMDRVKDETVI